MPEGFFDLSREREKVHLAWNNFNFYKVFLVLKKNITVISTISPKCITVNRHVAWVKSELRNIWHHRMMAGWKQPKIKVSRREENKWVIHFSAEYLGHGIVLFPGSKLMQLSWQIFSTVKARIAVLRPVSFQVSKEVVLQLVYAAPTPHWHRKGWSLSHPLLQVSISSPVYFPTSNSSPGPGFGCWIRGRTWSLSMEKLSLLRVEREVSFGGLTRGISTS